MGYHSHEYADGGVEFSDKKFSKTGQLAHSNFATNDPDLGFIRIFFYVTGFEKDNGNLKVVPVCSLCHGLESMRMRFSSAPFAM